MRRAVRPEPGANPLIKETFCVYSHLPAGFVALHISGYNCMIHVSTPTYIPHSALPALYLPPAASKAVDALELGSKASSYLRMTALVPRQSPPCRDFHTVQCTNNGALHSPHQTLTDPLDAGTHARYLQRFQKLP
jgi:hypothetical protein